MDCSNGPCLRNQAGYSATWNNAIIISHWIHAKPPSDRERLADSLALSSRRQEKRAPAQCGLVRSVLPPSTSDSTLGYTSSCPLLVDSDRQVHTNGMADKIDSTTVELDDVLAYSPTSPSEAGFTPNTPSSSSTPHDSTLPKYFRCTPYFSWGLLAAVTAGEFCLVVAALVLMCFLLSTSSDSIVTILGFFLSLSTPMFMCAALNVAAMRHFSRDVAPEFFTLEFKTWTTFLVTQGFIALSYVLIMAFAIYFDPNDPYFVWYLISSATLHTASFGLWLILYRLIDTPDVARCSRWCRTRKCDDVDSFQDGFTSP